MRDDTKQFITDLVAVQPRLQAMLMSLLANFNAMEEVLQETNTALWENRGEFEPGTNFGAWACKVAYYQVLTYRKKAKRERLRFNDQLLADLASVSTRRTEEYDRRSAALRHCVDELPAERRELIERRYADNDTPAALAESLGRPVDSMYTTLYRLRLALAECVRRKLEADPA
ncbi:MAG: sigma-70 family RNA polymerase sigma factor [Phycisphaera sp.]|nr:sigma-70 family RNA polymerase sigma factor [Phycisphaera sp.]